MVASPAVGRSHQPAQEARSRPANDRPAACYRPSTGLPIMAGSVLECRKTGQFFSKVGLVVGHLPCFRV